MSGEGSAKRADMILQTLSESVPAPWTQSGESPAQYMERITQKARGALEVLKTGHGDVLLAREVIADTIHLATYASALKEIGSARAVIQAMIAKETQHGPLSTKRSDS